LKSSLPQKERKPKKVLKNNKAKVDSLLSTEINLTTSSDEDDEFFVAFLRSNLSIQN
jgi:hypothetical protein